MFPYIFGLGIGFFPSFCLSFFFLEGFSISSEEGPCSIPIYIYNFHPLPLFPFVLSLPHLETFPPTFIFASSGTKINYGYTHPAGV